MRRPVLWQREGGKNTFPYDVNVKVPGCACMFLGVPRDGLYPRRQFPQTVPVLVLKDTFLCPRHCSTAPRWKERGRGAAAEVRTCFGIFPLLTIRWSFVSGFCKYIMRSPPRVLSYMHTCKCMQALYCSDAAPHLILAKMRNIRLSLHSWKLNLDNVAALFGKSSPCWPLQVLKCILKSAFIPILCLCRQLSPGLNPDNPSDVIGGDKDPSRATGSVIQPTRCKKTAPS